MTQPANLMLEVVRNLLTPFLIAAGLTDPVLARRTAEATIAAYKTTGQDQLLTAAQIIAFALAALDNLRLSLPEDISLSMKLKLRGNANALNRTAQKATAALQTQRHDAAEIPARVETAPKPADPTPAQPADHQCDLAWAAAMTDVASEYTAELANLPLTQRQAHLARIGALSDTARTLGSGKAPPLKARLLGGTAMQHQR